jgi:hypothetical protein
MALAMATVIMWGSKPVTASPVLGLEGVGRGAQERKNLPNLCSKLDANTVVTLASVVAIRSL